MNRTIERIGAALLIALFAWLWHEADRQNTVMGHHLARLEAFAATVEEITARAEPEAAEADTSHSAWKRDLMERPVLLPAGVLGGTMRIRAESDIRILDNRFVWARFDDGHITGSAVFERHNGPSGGNAWRMIGYLID